MPITQSDCIEIKTKGYLLKSYFELIKKIKLGSVTPQPSKAYRKVFDYPRLMGTLKKAQEREIFSKGNI